MTSNVLDSILDPGTGSPEEQTIPTTSPLRLNWSNLMMMVVFHLLAAAAVVYAVFHFSWYTVGLSAIWLACCGFSITGGYHRLFSHPTYRCIWPLKLFHLLFGAASVQNSALAWSSDHRVHHKHTDHDEDPYNIKKSFWWAHIGWIFFETRRPNDYRNVKDLLADPMICWQEKYYIPIAMFVGVLLPMLIGLLWGDPIGCLLMAGFLRLVLQYHFTFSINSLAHVVGHQPYSRANSARDSFFTAFLTLGEGYHNYHHRFPIDYRNGVRFYHFDPTKWILRGFSFVGITRDLRRTPKEIVTRAIEEVRNERNAPTA
ncbi:MAG: acyl-CoA desaturase [Planctomycetota bacterium]